VGRLAGMAETKAKEMKEERNKSEKRIYSGRGGENLGGTNAEGKKNP